MGACRHEVTSLDLLHKSEKLTISNFGFWILDFGLRDLGLLQEVYLLGTESAHWQGTGGLPTGNRHLARGLQSNFPDCLGMSHY
jgi:hypothetical protein